MNQHRAIAPLLASSLLGVTALAALVGGIACIFGAWANQMVSVGFVRDVGTAGSLITGVLLLAFAAMAAMAARDEWLERPRGTALGLVVAIATVLAAVVAMLQVSDSRWDTVFFVAAGLGIVTTVTILLAARAEPTEVRHGPA